MFHSTKLIAEASLRSAEEPEAVVPAAPKARRPRRALWLGLGGFAIAATMGAGWLIAHPVCGCALPPINPKASLSPQSSRLVTLSGRATQAAPVDSALANKGSDARPMALRPDAMLPGAVAPVH